MVRGGPGSRFLLKISSTLNAESRPYHCERRDFRLTGGGGMGRTGQPGGTLGCTIWCEGTAVVAGKAGSESAMRITSIPKVSHWRFFRNAYPIACSGNQFRRSPRHCDLSILWAKVDGSDGIG